MPKKIEEIDVSHEITQSESEFHRSYAMFLCPKSPISGCQKLNLNIKG